MKRLACLICLALCVVETHAQVAIGQWRDYLSYDQVHHVEVADHHAFAAAPMGLMHYDRDEGLVERMNKTTGLSDVGIATMAYDEHNDWLVIGYTNANVDLVHGGIVYNISDIKRSEMPADKSINRIRIANHKAYLACGFGIAVIDLTRREIQEAYYLGDKGTYDPVMDIAFDDTAIYAATQKGILYANRNNSFLNIVSNWKRHAAFENQEVTQLETHDGHWAAAVAGTTPMTTDVYLGTDLSHMSKVASGEVNSIRLSERLVVTMANEVKVLALDGTQQMSLGTFVWGEMTALDAVWHRNTLWIGHSWGGLIEHNPTYGTENTYTLQGPPTDNVYHITTHRDLVLVAPGGKKSTNENLWQGANLYTLEKERWSQLERTTNLEGLFDVVDVAVDPRDPDHKIAVAWGSGILDIRGNEVKKVYDDRNTPGLTAYTEGTFHSLRVGAVAFDQQGNAWVTNSLSPNGLMQLTPEGEWKAHNTQSMITTNDMEIYRIVCDSITGYKWITGKHNRIFVCDGNGKMAYVDPNQGSKLETHLVNCMVQDHDGELWFGTDKGIKVIYDGYRAMSNGGKGEKAPVNCSNILFSEDGVDEYLMAYENISNIVVDGANRKWVGTANNGLYLISENGQEQLRHFTAANSPLFSDKIVALAVQPNSGEVLIGTDKGLQSFRSTATHATQYNEPEIKVFPNPVRPDYQGMVAIKGFSRNAIVHITDAAGHVVYSCLADGGQAVWNLRTLEGTAVASGVYYVLASDINGQMRAVSKILVVR